MTEWEMHGGKSHCVLHSAPAQEGRWVVVGSEETRREPKRRGGTVGPVHAISEKEEYEYGIMQPGDRRLNVRCYVQYYPLSLDATILSRVVLACALPRSLARSMLLCRKRRRGVCRLNHV